MRENEQFKILVKDLKTLSDWYTRDIIVISILMSLYLALCVLFPA